MIEAPHSIDALIDLVRQHPKIGVLGNGTKDRLSAFEKEFVSVSTRNLSGILQYDASEYTITVLAGTPLKEINARLSQKGQYLPFSPVLVDAGATIGGTVASGLAGAGRFRYGSIRDFIIGARFIDGNGKLIAVGGKVVKNSAGFDVSKLLVGSLGRLGIMTELTFKVFPQAKDSATLRLACDSHEQAMERLMRAAGLKWELDALEYEPSQKTLYFRCAGPSETLQPMEGKMKEVYPTLERMAGQEAEAFWTTLREFQWASPRGILAKVPTTPKRLATLLSRAASTPGLALRTSAGAACTWICAETDTTLAALDQILSELELSGLVFRGSTSKLWLGLRRNQEVEQSVKKAMDPPSRFPSL